MTAQTGVNTRVSGNLGNGLITVYVLDCANCGVVYGINKDYEARRRDDGQTFYCPNGHGQSWAETETDRERQRRESAERALANAQESARSYRAALTVTKGQLTKAKNRANRGVCLHCQRSFANVQRHVEHMHPDRVAS